MKGRETDSLGDFQRELADQAGLSKEFIAASEHPYWCTCNICRKWWLSMGPEEGNDGAFHFGPFGDELWPDFAAKRDMTVAEAKSRYGGRET